MSFARHVIALAAVSEELEYFFLSYKYVFLIITPSKNYGVGVHAQDGDIIQF